MVELRGERISGRCAKVKKAISKFFHKLFSGSSKKTGQGNSSAIETPSKPLNTNKKSDNDARISNVAPSTTDITGAGLIQMDNRHKTPLETDPITRTSEPSYEVSSQVSSVTTPISELWNQAYDELRRREKSLMEDYEATLTGNLKAIISPTVALSGFKTDRNDQMKVIMESKIEEVKRNTWRLKFSDKEVSVKDLMKPVVGVIDWTNDYVSGAVSANPYASIAWAGVGLLLPLLLNPSKQAASLAEGLEYISGLIDQSSMRENLYCRYETNKAQQDHRVLPHSDIIYKETLKELYFRILEFQARSICYYSKNSLLKIGCDIVKWDSWDSLLANIKEKEMAFYKVYKLWRDTTYKDECNAREERHQESMKNLMSIGIDISGLRKAIEEAQRDSQRTELLEWLSSVDPSKNYNAARSKLHEDKEDGARTGEWLMQSNGDFKRWELNANYLLWLHGKAGSGKSVLSSSIIKYLKDSYESDPQTALGYFYFSFDDTAKQSTDGMLSSLIRQLCCRRPITPAVIKELRVQYIDPGLRPDTEKLENMLAITAHGFSKVYLVIDALDECPFRTGERRKLLHSLHKIRMESPENVHLLCTSRKESDIEAEISLLRPKIDVDLSIYREAIDRDIGLHIDKVLASSDYKSWPDSIKAETRAALIEKSDGMFQYIFCQFETFRKHQLSSPDEIRTALKNLPEGLDETYSRMLQNIDPKRQKQVAGALMWLAFSLRPLLLEELAEAFILDPKRPTPFAKSERLFKSEDVLKYLPGLVTKVPTRIAPAHSRLPRIVYDQNVWNEKEAIEIRLAHFSVKEYLKCDRIKPISFRMVENEAQKFILESCLAYIHHYDTAAQFSLNRYPLLRYSCQYWPSHLRALSPNTDGEAFQLLIGKCAEVHGSAFVFSSRVAFSGPLRLGNTSMAFSSTLHKLFEGKKIEDYLMDFNFNFDIASSLHRASSMGHLDLVELLIDAGADVDATFSDAGAALHFAAEEGHQKVVALLLERGANVNAIRFNHYRGEHGWTALHSAAGGGHEEVVRILLNIGADINAEFHPEITSCCTIMPATSLAKRHGDETIIQLLHDEIDPETSPDFKSACGQTPLIIAVEHGHIALVRLLVEEGANVNAYASFPGNPPLVYRSSDILLRRSDEICRERALNVRRILSSTMPRTSGHENERA